MKACLLILFSVWFAHAGINATPALRSPGLEISCGLSEKEIPVKDYRILVFEDSLLKDSLYVDLELPVYLQLELNKRYCLKFFKKGFLDRVVLVETGVPPGKERKRYSYEFEIEMLRDSSNPNTAGDLPVALIHYNAAEGAFSYSAQYAESIGHRPEFVVPVARSARNADVPEERPAKKNVVRRKM